MSINTFSKSVGLLAIALLGFSGVAEATGTEQLKAFLKNLDSLQTEFLQIEYDEHGKELRRSQGVLYIQRPGKFRWEYKTPHQQLILSDGEKVRLYDPDLAQMTVKSYKKSVSASPASLLDSGGDLDHSFSYKNLADKDGQQWVELLPLTPDASFKMAQLGLEGPELRFMDLTDNLGQHMRLQFSKPQRNLSLSNELFKFTPPADTDVIDDTLGTNRNAK